MSDNHIKSPAAFLVDSGLLFEINRRILHPLGLALAVEVPDVPDENVSSTFQVLDMREDPEGVIFEDETYLQGKAKLKAFLETCKFQERLMVRRTSLGFVVQSVPPEVEPSFLEPFTLE